GQGPAHSHEDGREGDLGDVPGRLDGAVRRAVPGSCLGLIGHGLLLLWLWCGGRIRSRQRPIGSQVNRRTATTSPATAQAARTSRSVPAMPLPRVWGL